MTLEPQNALEQLLVNASTDPAYRPQFYETLVKSDVYVVKQTDSDAVASGERMLVEGEQLPIRAIEHDGVLFIPLFSSLAQLQAMVSSGEVNYLKLNAFDLMTITQGKTPLWLNPASDYYKIFSPDEVSSILQGTILQESAVEQRTVTQPVEVMLGQPEKFPTELVEALTLFFKQKKHVKRAWVAHMYNPDDGLPPHTLLAIDTTGDFDALSTEVAAVVINVHIPDPPVDMIPITGQGGLESYFLKEKPFYVRRWLGLF